MNEIVKYFIKAYGCINEIAVQKIINNLKIQSYSKGDTLYRQGEIPSQMFFLIDGLVLGVLASDDISEIHTIIFSPGKWVGEEYISEKIPLTLNLIAEEDSEVALLDFNVVREIMIADSAFATSYLLNLSSVTAKRNYITLRRLYSNSHGRIFHTLAFLFEISLSSMGYNKINYDDAQKFGLEIRISQQSLAKISASGRTSVSILLKNFEDFGILVVGYSTIRFFMIDKWRIVALNTIMEPYWKNNLSVNEILKYFE